MAHYSAAGFSRISGITLPSLRKDTSFVYRVDFWSMLHDLPDLSRLLDFRTGKIEL
jgi:hypothetical protein